MNDTTPTQPFDAVTLAYVAGLFDGEGSIVIGCSKVPPNHPVRKSPNYWLQVGITNTDRELIEWLHGTFGGHISDNSHSPSRKKQRPCWAWRTMSKDANAFLQAITPYLRTKKEQAVIAINFQEHMTTTMARQVLSAELIEVREKYRSNLRALTLGTHTL
jgi:hypothetical protein